MKITAFTVALVITFFCFNRSSPITLEAESVSSNSTELVESKNAIVVFNFHNEGENAETDTPFLRIILNDFPRDKVTTFAHNVCLAIDLEIKNSGGVHTTADYEKLGDILARHLQNIFSYHKGVAVFFLPKTDVKYYILPEEIESVVGIKLLKV